MNCHTCGGHNERAGYCLGCGSVWPGNRPSETSIPLNPRQPVPLIDTSEERRRGNGAAEGVEIILQRRAGFVPVIIWLGYTINVPGVGAVAPHDVRIDLVGRGPDGEQLYTLVNEAVRYFSIGSDGYHALPIPFVGGTAEVYRVRMSTAGRGRDEWQFGVQWGYRPRQSRVPEILGHG